MERKKTIETTHSVKLSSKVILLISFTFLLFVAVLGFCIDNATDGESVKKTLEEIMILDADIREMKDDIHELDDLVANTIAKIVKVEDWQKKLQSGQINLGYELQTIRTELNRLETEYKERYSNFEEKFRIFHDKAVENDSRIRILELDSPRAEQNLCSGNVD